MAEQTEKAFLKQPKVFLSSKKSDKGKRPEKGGNRFWKNIGLGFKTPREAIEGTMSIRGRILAGTCHSAKMQKTITVRRNYLHFVKKIKGIRTLRFMSHRAFVSKKEIMSSLANADFDTIGLYAILDLCQRQ